MPTIIKCGKGCVYINMRKIKISPSRVRKDFSLVPELADSIGKVGLIHPITVNRIEDEKFDYQLNTGETRLRACVFLGAAEIPAIVWDDLSPFQQKTHELEENLRRRDLDWVEECELVSQLDDLKRGEHGSAMPGTGKKEGWELKDTARILGTSVGTVSTQLALAKTFEERPDLKERVKEMPMGAAKRMIAQTLDSERLQRLQASGQLQTTSSLANMDCRDYLSTLKSNSVHLLLTDPPFGIPVLEDLRGKDRGETQSYTRMLKDQDNATAEDVAKLFETITKDLYRVMVPGAHFYIFFAFECYSVLTAILRKEGFDVNPVPIVWSKGRTTSPFKGYDYSPCYEPILFGRKPPRDRRLNKPSSTIVEFPPVSPNNKIHPFEKPLALLTLLISQSTKSGETVLDPFAGSGKTLLAAQRTGRSGIGCEVNQEHWTLAQGLLGGGEK